MQISEKSIVRINFKLSNDRGELIDASREGEPMEYRHGDPDVLPCIQNQLSGKAAGDEFSFTISPAQGFGEHLPELIVQVPIEDFPSQGDLAPGAQLNASTEQGDETYVVTEVHSDHVVADGNHPLAGITLQFSGDVVEVRSRTN
jgi:FKBP-type peptidyl-prolyl cis-trans isomerase SlyD